MNSIKFYDEKHEETYVTWLQELKNNNVEVDCYRRPICYLLALTDETRKNIKLLFNLKNGDMLNEGLHASFQTGTTSKITRLAFNLYNGWQYENEQEWEESKVSKYYSVDEIFCCKFATYFYEAIKLRYPGYVK